ncbi:endonuclease/exonuclease/phosphatase family protein [bacterium]|nr:endonuclease/exonuclease/phosphatase family protein [bacterium]
MFFSLIRLIISVLLPLCLWLYAALAAFIWYGARYTPERAILLRLASSILSDLIWVPFGLLVWTLLIDRVIVHVIRVSKSSRRIPGITTALAGAVLLFVFFFEQSFKFLFLPLLWFIMLAFLRLIRKSTAKKSLSHYAPLVCILLLVVVHYHWQLVPHGTREENPGDIRVMSYNIFARAGFEDRMKVINTIKHISPDVVCIMEFNPMRDPELFREELGNQFPYMLIGDNLTRWTRSAALILSRFPLKKIDVPIVGDRQDRHVNFIFAEMNVGGRTINIVNYHLITVGHRIEKAARKNINDKELVTKATDTEAAIDGEKFEQARYLMDTVATFKQPTILCGDLNDTPNSRAFQLLESRFYNTYSEKGWGLGDTFGESWIKRRSGNFPWVSRFARDVMRIDHIFVSKDITMVSSEVLRHAQGSDHKPVVAAVRLP